MLTHTKALSKTLLNRFFFLSQEQKQALNADLKILVDYRILRWLDLT